MYRYFIFEGKEYGKGVACTQHNYPKVYAIITSVEI